jgi:AcrR family transcriptional regulator
MTTAGAVRRQARGRARMESILDAAEQLVAEVGYDEMSTNAIAARAGISPGSLYQFYGNKAALLEGLVGRYAEQLDAFWAAQLSGESVTQPIDVVVDRVVDAVIEFKTGRPAFWALLHGSATAGALADASCRFDSQLAAGLDDLFAARAPHLAPERRRLIADVSVATVKSLIALVVGDPTHPSTPAATHELKQVLTNYLTPALAPPT